jgi:hypothetical protein
MKNIIPLFTILFFAFSNAQSAKIFESKNVVISAEKDFKKENISIIMSEASLDFKNIFLLSENNQDYIKIDGVFPKDEGFYTLLITYKDFIYREVIWYMKNPENEKLEFNFYKSKDRLLCRINSRECIQLNKDVILFKLTAEEKKKMLDEIRKKK